MASFHHRIKSGKKGSATDHSTYITRQGTHRKREEDLVATGFGNMPGWAQNDAASFWRSSDRYERANGAVYREHEIALPEELTLEQQQELVSQLVPALVGNKPFQYAIHAPDAALGSCTNTHLHLMFSDRENDGIERSPEQTFRRYNAKHPERGGRRKDSGGKTGMELRDQMIATRKKCADIQNSVLEKYGHTARVDHRTLKAQGIDRQPERHLGQARIRSMSPDDREQYGAQRRKQVQG
ncbi:MobA/MobL family protein [Paraburkholderia caballeronis]|uniref:MobA/MobL family protein n=1 Tax=Paraburkholderia caballeronis TaxID=416943 RepID=A0A1H7MT77_9BURK|nr:MobA/MobL family protein [Paraburkholderia caballeronis]PXW26447.1 MobA/MobL family protein [Paraburkholderia caballeronis]PXX01994.1 MobA/MobL family protein [Paraburkholderia caballeronis]RAK01151.1 MobA/MobL family protein [Paraburkholderia caballeronis]SEB95053.1 MobA/MobL family protein [Paraburkholderia caballeronis]SEL14008.1 MobA/MobL family protein [Paraburkholderia caballeronis]